MGNDRVCGVRWYLADATMSAARIFVVTKKDTVEQIREYVVRAHDPADAEAMVDGGMFIMESAPETVDTLNSYTDSVTEVEMNGNETEVRKDVGL